MMKQLKYSLVLLGASASLAACSSAGTEQERHSPDPQSRRENHGEMAARSLSLAEEKPCSIEKATPVPDGIRLVFGKGIFWHYHELGNTGIGGFAGGVKGVVIRIVTGPDGHDVVLPEEPHLDLKYGSALWLSEHHDACRVRALRDQGRAYLRTEGSFCFHATPCSRQERTYEIGG